MHYKGVVTISKVTDESGREIPIQKAVDYGLIIPVRNSPAGWGIPKEEVCLGYNLILDSGRQNIAFLAGGRSPITSFVISSFGAGTGITPAKVTDVALENPLTFASTLMTKPIDGVDYPAPFVARFSMTIGAGDFNGQLLTELGLYSGNGTLVARKVLSNGLNKSGSAFSPTLSWRVRT